MRDLSQTRSEGEDRLYKGREHAAGTGENALDDRKRAAFELTKRLASDTNVLATSLLPPPKSSAAGVEPPIELLVVVSKMPFDLDLLGMKRAEEQGRHATLFYVTKERLETAIDDEAGCWFTSGRILYGETLHDPVAKLANLRRAVNNVPKVTRHKAFQKWFTEARAFPTIAMNRGITAKDAPESILLRDNAALARALFLLNARPPRGETWLMDDVMQLEKLPPGIEAISDVLGGMDRLDLRRFERARKVYGEIISEVKRLAKVL